MSDIVITPANVKPTGTTLSEAGTSGEALLAGQPIYRNATDGKLYRASAASLAASRAVGIALNSTPGADQPVKYGWYGRIQVGAVLTPGAVYVLSINAGFIAPSADLDASTGTWWATVLGVSPSNSDLELSIKAAEAQNP